MLDLPYSARRQEAQLVYRQRRRLARRRAWLRNLVLGLLALGLLAAPGMATAMQRQHRRLHIDVRGAVLTLNPLQQGSGPVTLQVTLATRSGAPVAGVPVRIEVSGAVPFTGVATTNDAGIADSALPRRPRSLYGARPGSGRARPDPEHGAGGGHGPGLDLAGGRPLLSFQ